MCAICMKIPCDSRCPNAPEIKPVHICINCGSSIFSGEKYFEGPDGPICKDCMDDMTTDDVLKMLGEKYSTAETEDIYGI